MVIMGITSQRWAGLHCQCPAVAAGRLPHLVHMSWVISCTLSSTVHLQEGLASVVLELTHSATGWLAG